MLHIIINNQPITLGSPLPDTITHLSIICGAHTQIPIEHTLLIKDWITSIVSKLDCEYISYNNVLIPVSDFKGSLWTK